MKEYKINYGLVEVGVFLSGEYQEYDEDSKKYLDVIQMDYKQNDDGTQGVSSSGNKETMNQWSQGRRQYEYDYTIKVYDALPYKGGDKVKLYENNQAYQIQEVVYDSKSTNNILNLYFPKLTGNKPRVLVLKAVS